MSGPLFPGDNPLSDDELRERLRVATDEAPPLAPQSKVIPGGSFALNDTEARPLWGVPGEVVWAEGEPMLLVGPVGIGKTTLLHRLVLARCGCVQPKVLGLPVEATDKPVLLVAADRPRQARRSLRRMVEEADRTRLDRSLIVWEGPPGFDIAREPERFAAQVADLRVGTVVIDSLKDVAARLSEDETGSGLTRAFGLLAAAGIEVVAAHHHRKATEGNRQPRALDDVYGSTWIAAGAGTVALLWGKPGDPVVELSLLKYADGEIGPFSVEIDHTTGRLRVVDDEHRDPLALLRAAPRGLTPRDLARSLYGSEDPTKAETERARRRLDRLVTHGKAHKREGEQLPGTGARTGMATYVATEERP